MFGESKPSLTTFGDIFWPGEASEPILARPVRMALTEWLTELWSEDELAAVGISARKKAIFDGPPGVGKALDIATPIPTASGWTTMEEVQVGDTLFDDKGLSCRVTAVSPVMFDRDCFCVRFENGEEIIADSDHIWFTTTAASRQSVARMKRNDIHRKNGPTGRDSRHLRIRAGCVTTREIFKTLRAQGKTNHQVPVCMPIAGRPSMLLVDPYTLGAWLGDGETLNGRIHAREPEIMQTVGGGGYQTPKQPEHGFSVPGLSGHLRHIGVLGNKHIPEQYKRAMYNERLELLRGLMDTDGTCSAVSGRCGYTTVKKKLGDDVYELALSLGMRAFLKEGVAKLNGRVISEKYTIAFQTDVRVFNLPRKAARQRIGGHLRRGHGWGIVSCDPVLTRPVKCIAVDSLSKLYLAGKGFIPTHNTTLAHHLSARIGLPMLAVRPERLISKWLGETARNVGKLFDLAATGLKEGNDKAVPIVLFIDEFDAISHQRGRSQTGAEEERNAWVNTLLQCIDRYKGFLIAATNFGEHVDQAIWRRFDMHITLALPGQDERERILARYLMPFGLPRRALSGLAEAFDIASPALMRAWCENLKRQLVIGPKLNSDMRREPVIERILASVHPHPDLGKPRLWTLMGRDPCLSSLPWPLPQSVDVQSGHADDETVQSDNVVVLGGRAPS